MGGRKKLPAAFGRQKQEVVRLTPDEQLDFQAAAFMLRRYRSDVLRDAIYSFIEDAKRLDHKRFQSLRKKFADGDTPQ